MKSFDQLWSLLIKQKKQLYDRGIIYEKSQISYGDRYSNEIGEEISITLHNKKYYIGYSTVTEDHDDWAQAESYSNTWCHCKGHKHMPPIEIYNLIDNYERDKRDDRIEKLLKSQF
jgi:hypothetical protein